MTGYDRRPMPLWLLSVALLALIGGPILYQILPLAGVPAALVSSVVVVGVKHLGLAGVLLTPLYALLRRRRPGMD